MIEVLDGFSNVFDLRLRIIFVSVLIFSGSFLIGLAVSSNHSPLKLSYLLFFLNLFNKNSTNTAAPVPIQTNDDIIARRMQEIQSLQTAMTDTDNSSSQVFAIICGAFFIICILWFFLSPFIKRTFANVFRGVDLKSIFTKFFKAVGEIFKKLFHLRLKMPVINSANARRFGNDMAEFLKTSRKSKEKKAELDRLTKKFMLVIDWGTEHGFEYTKNLAPAEYTQLLKNENAIKAGLYFEKALYDKECLSQEEEKDFNSQIEQLCG